MVAKELNDVEINEIWNQWSRAVKKREVIEAFEWARGVEDLITTNRAKGTEIERLRKIEETAKNMCIAQKLFADAVEDNDVSELERASNQWNKAMDRLDTLLGADK